MRSRLLCAAVALSLSLALPLALSQEGFGDHMSDLISARVLLFSARWQQLGFFEVLGRPLLAGHPAAPLADNVYQNHSPLFYWAIHAVDRLSHGQILVLRAFPLLAFALVSYGLLRRARKVVSPLAATLGLALVWTTPLFLFEAKILHGEGYLLLFVAAQVLMAEARRPFAVFLLSLVATAQDWSGYLGPMAVGIALCLRGSLWRERKVLLASALAVFLGAFLHGAILWRWNGDFAGISEAIQSARDREAFARPKSIVGYFQSLAALLGPLVPVSLILPVGFGMWRAFRERFPSALDRCGLAVFGWVFAYAALLPGRSEDHACWWLGALAPLAWFAMRGLSFLRGCGGAIFGCALCLLVCAENAMRGHERFAAEAAASTRVQEFVAILGGEDLDGGFLATQAHTSFALLAGLPSADYALEPWALRAFFAGEIADNPLVCVQTRAEDLAQLALRSFPDAAARSDGIPARIKLRGAEALLAVQGDFVLIVLWRRP